MQKLNIFLHFDLAEFLRDKLLEIMSIKEHRQYIDGQPGDVDGVTLKVAIVKDGTDYGTPGISNLYESFNIIIKNAKLENVISVYTPGTPIKIKTYNKATVYGQYRNELSVQCSGLESIESVSR